VAWGAMMARMAAEQVQTGRAVGRLPALVSAYARRVSSATLEQHRAASVSSPLGVWLLLVACAPAAQGSDRAELEDALGCSSDEASRLLAAFVASPPPALSAALAVWVRIVDATAELTEWVRAMPDSVSSGFMPTQAEADAWAQRETLGLIRRFPMKIDELTRIVLASALATKVSWEVPFGVVPAVEQLGVASPWRSAVSRLLWDGAAEGRAMIARTKAVGLVAVHCAVAREDLTVVSVSAAPDVDRALVLAAAYEVAATVSGDWGRGACSLYDLPLGPGHSWEISEQEVPTRATTPRLERIAGVCLPAWRAENELDLTLAPAFGTGPALQTLRELIGPRADDRCAATQAAVASFTRYGFEAAAVSALGIRTAAMRRPGRRSVERAAVLRFDHPFAAVAIAGRPWPPRPSSPPRRSGSGFTPVGDESLPGLPLFSAWVHEPIEAEERPPAQ
jgi:Serpin (serine protease inhibitor)